MAANVDDHNKNFSFVMDRDGAWHIAPAYDFTFTVDPSAPYYVNRHSMTINGENHNICRNDLSAVAKRYNIKAADSIISQAIEVVKGYRKYALEAKVSDGWIKKIETEMTDRISSL